MKRTPLKRTPLKRTPFKKKPPKLAPKSRKSNGLRIRIDPLDSLFSEFIRKRAVARVGGCEYCLKPYRWQDLQNSHFFGRGDKSTRWDEDDCAGLCFYCHNYFHAHPLLHVQWFKKHLGERAFELLEGRNRIMGKPDKTALTLYLTHEIKKLDAQENY